MIANPRTAMIERETGETSVSIALNLDGSGTVHADTGVLFFDHMLHAFGKHSGFDLNAKATGDSAMDPHHTVEDTGIVLGQAIKSALGDRVGIVRYGFAYAPLDESLARVVVDCSGRPFLEFQAEMTEPLIGEFFASSLVEEFWRAVAVNAGLTMHIDLVRSRNAHHGAEAIFKASALAARQAVAIRPGSTTIPSTKGVL